MEPLEKVHYNGKSKAFIAEGDIAYSGELKDGYADVVGEELWQESTSIS
jgi:hypothetical protein